VMTSGWLCGAGGSDGENQAVFDDRGLLREKSNTAASDVGKLHLK